MTHTYIKLHNFICTLIKKIFSDRHEITIKQLNPNKTKSNQKPNR